MTKRGINLRTGQAVRIDGHVSDGDGSCHGMIGRVVGQNHTERGSDGVQRTVVELPDGSVASVPSKALRNADRR